MLWIYESTVIPNDFLFFISKEFNQKSTMDLYIHNYALIYALQKIFRIVSIGHKPQYENEIYDLLYYCSPAYPLEKPLFSIHTYNSIDTLRNTPQERKDSRRNIPSFGQYQKIVPLTTKFRFYILSIKEIKKFPRIIRIGKKLAPCRLLTQLMDVKQIDYHPDNAVRFSIPINLLDISPNNEIEESSIYYMSPSPLVTNTVAKIPYVIATSEERKKEIIIPIPKHFANSKFSGS